MRHRVGDQPRRGDRDLLADRQPVLAQRRAGRREVDNRLDEPDPAAEALRRLGVVRVATKYPRVAADFFERTGRQAEIVEVKGSVELAPLTGLVHGIVDLTATGTTLRENRLAVREEIAVATARLIANPVAHKLKAEAIDQVLERLRGRG